MTTKSDVGLGHTARPMKAQRFVLYIEPVDEFPGDEMCSNKEHFRNYAFIEAADLDTLCRKLAVHLDGPVVTDTQAYLPEITTLPPVSLGGTNGR